MTVLITGTPRSGTHAVAEYFGYAHERIDPKKPGTVDFNQIERAIAPDAYGFSEVSQLVRHPYFTIASLADLCRPGNAHWRWITSLRLWSPTANRYVNVANYLDHKRSPLANAAAYWYAINGWLLYETDADTLRLENFPFYDPNKASRFSATSYEEIFNHGGAQLAMGVRMLGKRLGYSLE